MDRYSIFNPKNNTSICNDGKWIKHYDHQAKITELETAEYKAFEYAYYLGVTWVSDGEIEQAFKEYKELD